MPAYTLASWKRRLSAFIIDGFICLALAIFIGYFAFSQHFGSIPPLQPIQVTSSTILLALAPHFIGVTWLLGVSFLESRYGATPAKWLLGIRVVPAKGKSLSFLRALLRNILKGALSLLSILGTFTNDRKQSVHDLVAQTLVIRAK